MPSPAVRVRSSRAALLAVFLLAVCVTPVALTKVWLAPLYLLPLVLAVRVLRAGTDVDAGGITLRALVGRRTVSWEEVAGVDLPDRGGIWLVLRSGSRLRLPSVTPRHLPVIAAASGGRLELAGEPAGRRQAGQRQAGQQSGQ